MKQVLQSLKNGSIELADVPCPNVGGGQILIQTTHSLISAGTERMLVEFGQASLLAKARAQPDKVKQVLDKIKTEGLLPTLEAVFKRLDEPLPLGYCNVGRVVEVGRGVQGFSVGDRVASNGPHAEMVSVPANLCARIPDGLDDVSATFTVLGSIALHGVRLMHPTLGERFVVVGLGLLGLIGVQLLRASGCHVLGVDVNPDRCKLAEAFGAETVCVGQGGDPVAAAMAFSGGVGVDGVCITASAKTDEIIHQAAQSCRKRGRIVLVGVIGLNLRRSDFYEKELTFQVSCSYGPGRYDNAYEQKGQDYPLAYVRWTEQRNFGAMLEAMAAKQVDVASLISKHIAHGDAAQAYDAIVNDGGVLGVVLDYPEQEAPRDNVITIHHAKPRPPARPGSPQVAVIGAGNFTKMALLPALTAAGASLHSVVSAKGVTGRHAAIKHGAAQSATDYRRVLDDPNVGAVFITTRHNSHANMVIDSLEAGKHVFVEKPLAIDVEGLDRVHAAYVAHPEQQLMVGFNRRFAPFAVRAKQLLAGRSQPICVNMMVNAGAIPPDVWVHDPEVGGGRIIGEGCHFIDLALFLVGKPISLVHAVMFGPNFGGIREDKMSINLTFADGSLASIQYWANGPKSFPKERVEIFSEERVLAIDNWRKFVPYEWKGAKKASGRMDKGHKAEVAAFLEAARRGGEALIPFVELEQVTQASFAAIRSAAEGAPVRLVAESALESSQADREIAQT